ncbi:MAG: hypothetical protein ACOX3S_06160 [Anaerolineae bacterium]|jgi:hypothetical protein
MYVSGRAQERFLGKDVVIADLDPADTMAVCQHSQTNRRLCGVDAAGFVINTLDALHPEIKRPQSRL